MLNFDYEVGDRVRMLKTISTVNGTLYKGTVVKITAIEFPDKDIEVKDPVGQLWYLYFGDVEKWDGKK